MESLSSILMLKAMDGLTLRSQATSENIANAGTAHYRPARVSFEDALAQAALGGRDAVAAVRPEIFREAPDPTGSGLRLDLELATASSTAARYAALVEVLNRQMQISALVVQGGR